MAKLHRDFDRDAYLRACESMGMTVRKPTEYERRHGIIVSGDNNRRYRVAKDMSVKELPPIRKIAVRMMFDPNNEIAVKN